MRYDVNIPLPLSRAAVHAELMVKRRASLENIEAQRIREVAQEFEALLLEHMIKEMRNTVPESPIFGRNRGREIFEELLDGEFARLMENRGGIGIAQFMATHMIRDSGADQPPENARPGGSSLLRNTR